MTLYNTAKKIVQKISAQGYIAYFAGGYVRDLLMKHPSADIDIVTDATIEVLQKLFPKTIPVGINFGIIIVVEDGHHFEVATFRQESEYKDGRRPQKVIKGDPKEDALRRDFTINGMFYDPISESLYDYVGGQEDIRKGVIRAIGNPHERFLEDRLRMIRAVRYAARFRFAIDPETLKAIIYHSSDLFPAVAMERVYQEFKKMADFPHFDEALVMLHRLDLLEVIFPALQDVPLEEIELRVQNIRHFPKEAPVIAKLLELFPSADLAEKLSLCDYLKLANSDKLFIEELELWKVSENFDDYEWAHIYAKPSYPICLAILQLQQKDPTLSTIHESRFKKLETAIHRIQNHTTLVTASHLLARGIKPGKEMGALLKQAERTAINHNLSTPEEVLKHLKLNNQD